jgi:hypothetical protein
MRACSRCFRILEDTEFNWRRKNKKRASHCKDCSRKLIRDHYLNNRLYYLEKVKKRNLHIRQEVREYIGSFLQNNSCVDCGEKDILVLEFDHRDRSTKSYDINEAIHKRLSLTKVISEIKKCDIRCSNCHRRKTEIENNSWKLQFAPVV